MIQPLGKQLEHLELPEIELVWSGYVQWIYLHVPSGIAIQRLPCNYHISYRAIINFHEKSYCQPFPELSQTILIGPEPPNLDIVRNHINIFS